MGNFKIKLNSVGKIESILQEVYDDSVRQINLINSKISDIENSTNLKEATIEMKAKYAKAIHDYITDKEKAIGRKLEVSKVMAEVLKSKGDVDKVVSDKDILNNLEDAFAQVRKNASLAPEAQNRTKARYY